MNPDLKPWAQMFGWGWNDYEQGKGGQTVPCSFENAKTLQGQVSVK
jgi:hypothetical protein